MGLRDLPFWARIAGTLANDKIDAAGAKRCAIKGHKWRDVTAIVLRQDGGVDELPKGSAQRCSRCGATREAPPA